MVVKWLKVKVGFLYSAAYAMTRPARFYNLESGSWVARASGAAAQTAAIQLHALTYNWTRVMQLANTPPLQWTTPGFHPLSILQTSPPVRGSKYPITAYYSIYRPWKDERLGWPSWLTCSGRFTHISGHPSAAGRAQDRESSPAKDRRSTTVYRNCVAGCETVVVVVDWPLSLTGRVKCVFVCADFATTVRADSRSVYTDSQRIHRSLRESWQGKPNAFGCLAG